MLHSNMLPELNAPRTALLSQVEVQSLRDRVLEASAELVEVGALEEPPLLPMVAEVTASRTQQQPALGRTKGRQRATKQIFKNK